MSVLALHGVAVRRDGRDLLAGVDWQVEPGEHWVVLGRNGSGKTTLVRVAALHEHPSTGTVDVAGERLGRTDVRSLRRRIAVVSAAVAELFRPGLTAAEVVMCAKHAALEPWWHQYDDTDRERARELLGRHDVRHLADRAFGTLSSGERQRVLLARALMAEPVVLLLDEPAAGLDLGAREELVASLERHAATPGAPPAVLVTHQVEEIPVGFTHVLALAEGRPLRSGPLATTLDAALLGATFGMDVELERHGDGRWSARRRSGARASP